MDVHGGTMYRFDIAQLIAPPTVRCNHCEWEGTEDKLQWVSAEINNPESDYKACPNCLTDSYLIDLKN